MVSSSTLASDTRPAAIFVFFAALLKFSIVLETLFTLAPISPLTEFIFSIAASMAPIASRAFADVSNETRPHQAEVHLNSQLRHSH